LEHKQRIASLKLIPASGGVFEVVANGELIYSKLKTGQFPDFDSIKDEISRRL
tara:strand:- start:227 stop:385 length:159 start_codon:yes stop_codon:yes gene_type:complete